MLAETWNGHGAALMPAHGNWLAVSWTSNLHPHDDEYLISWRASMGPRTRPSLCQTAGRQR